MSYAAWSLQKEILNRVRREDFVNYALRPHAPPLPSAAMPQMVRGKCCAYYEDTAPVWLKFFHTLGHKVLP